MAKKFDVVIGNPPYGEDAEGKATHGKPIYDRFMDAAYEVADKAVLITPARFLFNAGYTPKAWNAKMLSDEHLSVVYYAPNSDALFPGTDIKGGVVVTYRDADKSGTAIGTFTSYPELNEIVQKVSSRSKDSLASLMTSSRSYRYTEAMHESHPEAKNMMAKGEQFKINTKTFDQLPFLYSEDLPSGSKAYVRVYGLHQRTRMYKWIEKAFVSGPSSFEHYKVALPKANGAGRLGEALSHPVVLEPEVAVTQSFLTIGDFEAQTEAEACLKYVKMKFARVMLGVLKITQDNPARVWQHVPVQDFSSASDIAWDKPISEIDSQLFAKYGLSDPEVEFIMTTAKEMD